MKNKDIKIAGVIQQFCWILPGKFMLGSLEGERERNSDEVWHEVVLTQGYWLANAACTQELWEAVMGDNPSRFKEDKNNPVESVNWHDTMEFIDRLNELAPELNLRLPTEAQWEYACRAGTTTPFSFGESITTEQANYDGNYPYPRAKKGVYRDKTMPVKTFPCNQWGLYEMHGNVWEWCADWFGDYSASCVVDPGGLDKGDNRVLRGGSWFNLARNIRSACRHRYAPGFRNSHIGFRLAMLAGEENGAIK